MNDILRPPQWSKNELRLHYRCEFDVAGELPSAEIFRALIKGVRQWLTDTRGIPTQAVQGAWFYNDGQWVSPGKDHSSIRTSRFEDGPTGQAVWAVRYEHSNVSNYR